MSENNGLKGINVSGASAEQNNAPLVFVESQKDGRKLVMTKTVLSGGSKQKEAVSPGSVFTGRFEGISVKSGTNGYEDKSYVCIRAEDGTLYKIKATKSLAESMGQAKQLGLQEGDLLQISYVDTIITKTGRTFVKFDVQI